MEAIRYYVKGAFRDVLETPEALEQQEELIADMTAKVEDLVAEGKPRDEALGLAIASVGDLSTLVAEFSIEQDGQAATDNWEPVPTARVLAGPLDFHSVLITVGIVVLLMLGATILANNTIGPEVAVVVALGIAGAGWWTGSAIRRLRGEPIVEERQLLYAPRVAKSAAIAASVMAIAFLANIWLASWEFWAWSVWIAALVFPVRVLVERQLTRAGWFQAAEEASPEGD